MENLINEFLSTELSITQFCKDKKINIEKFKEELRNRGHIIQKSATPNIIRYLHLAIKDYQTGIYSISQLSKKYNISTDALSNNFKKLNIEIINRQNEVKFNQNVFDSIDTEEKAYWLGFIYADGCITSRNEFELSLSDHDYKYLLKFNTFVNHKDSNHVKINKASYNKQRCRWSIRNAHLVQTLNNLGCTFRKSLILKFPKLEIFKDESLIRHFIRGYFDGDGCFGYSYNYNKTFVYCKLTLLGTEDFLANILQICKIPGKINKRKNIYCLSFTKENSIKFANYLYDNCNIYLDRKYFRYNLFINKHNNAVPYSDIGDY